ncbi:TfoX/Sxy family DNA transformation protein [Enterobacteriaceae bacterium H20N1]|uniref:TfoX/Sxy family DNA transformation protein n=1 Tax=Dryocola boscaweniae TaxID=2925397 RepID=A0A9X2W501_9ENTR|nr:TfoX/Sxy family DNA transformation protein [Dryocola boscaweniae]MCT4701153.1 TfoX/Sxy family DNA transformation protein [Dryocola boscaweniae]MCT4718342.1 TfoX/Sxy family DNA transformation protein [Dryocola boscaweniae]
MKFKSYDRIHKSQEYLAPLGDIDYRSQFGGYSLAIGNVVFAMVAEGELYLRACEDSETYFVNKAAPPLIFNKRGRPIVLNYYQVDEELWQDPDKLLELSSNALANARREKSIRKTQRRLKDLPNLSVNIEIWLWEAGIADLRTLQAYGAKRSWIKLRSVKKFVGVKILLALAGAISGIHEAALPAVTRQELLDWYHRYEQRRRR